MINRKHLKLISLILILIISIGFAYLTSSLVINGIIGYKGNTWNIYFDNIHMITNDVGGDKPTINNSKNTVDFSITFSEPGEVYKFSVDVVNDGTIDAMLSEILTTGINSSNSKYLSYTVKYYDDTELSVNDGIKAGTKTRLNVEVNYKYETDELAPVGDQDFSLKLTYVQASDNAVFKNSVVDSSNNNIFTINNAKSNSLSNLKIYGNSSQTTYQGYQLLKKDGLSTPASDSEFWNTLSYDAPGEDGWIHININNTEGTETIYANYFIKSSGVDYTTDSDYTIFVEYKNYTGSGGGVTISQLRSVESFSSHSDNGHLEFASNSSNNHKKDSTSGTLVFLVHTKQNLSETTCSLRGFSSASVGNAYEVDLRITIVEGNHLNDTYEWEPYVGGEPSPNPDYPQEINSVTGDSSLKIVGKNLLDYKNIIYRGNNSNLYVDEDDYVYDAITNSDGRVWGYNQSQWHLSLPKGTYTMSLWFKNQSTRGDNKAAIYNDKSKAIVSTFSIANSDFKTVTFTLANTTNIGILIKSYDGVYRIQLEEGNTYSDWEVYKESIYPITLGNAELNKINNYQDSLYYDSGSWIIERNVGTYTITGLESFNWEVSIPRIYTPFSTASSVPTIFPSDIAIMPIAISNKYTTVSIYDIYHAENSNKKDGFTISPGKFISFRRKKWTDKTTAINETIGTKLYFANRYLVKEKITDSTLLSQLNAIKNNNLFSGTNHIYFDSNIGTDISFDYVEE